MFNLLRFKGLYLFDEIDGKKQLSIDLQEKEIFINFYNLNIHSCGGHIFLLNDKNSEVFYSNLDYDLLKLLMSAAFDSQTTEKYKWNKIKLIDKAFSLKGKYPDLLMYCDDGLIAEMFNKKFVKYCLKENKYFSISNWRDFNHCEKIKKEMPKELQKICLKYPEIFDDEYQKKENLIKLAKMLNYNKEKEITRIGLHCMMGALDEMPELWAEIKPTNNLIEIKNKLYKARFLKWHKKYLKNFIKQEEKILELENLKSSNYYIFVPRSMEELVDEAIALKNDIDNQGKKVANETDFIYFIKRKNDSKHRYIACRYNIEYKATVETKGGFNKKVNFNHELKKLIEEIDRIILAIVE